jgi:hypothetical protein
MGRSANAQLNYSVVAVMQLSPRFDGQLAANFVPFGPTVHDFLDYFLPA